MSLQTTRCALGHSETKKSRSSRFVRRWEVLMLLKQTDLPAFGRRHQGQSNVKNVEGL